MDLQSIAKTILPRGVVASLRRAKWERERKRVAAISPLSEQDFRQLLTNDLGLDSGAVVYVHSAIDQLNLDFPFYSILSLIQEIIGEQGTVLFPTYPNQNISSYEYLQQGNVFDVRRTPSYTGILTELARRHRKSVRSLHPTKPVSAIGQMAREITATHHLSPYPYDNLSPYYKLMQSDARIIGLGLSTTYLSFVHCVDDALKDAFPVRPYHDKLFEVDCIDYDGVHVLVGTYVHDMRRFTHVDVPRFMKHHVSPEACQDLEIQGMRFFRASARKLFAELMQLAERGITIYSHSRRASTRGR